MRKTDCPSVEYLRQCFRYENGKLFWLNRPRDHFVSDSSWKCWNTKFAGKEAGGFRITKEIPNIKIGINSSVYFRHVIIWVILKGEWPPADMIVDHINRNTIDDRIENLRLATPSQSAGNTKGRRSRKSKYKGVCYVERRNKYKAKMMFEGKLVLLEFFDTEEEANAAYIAVSQKYFGEFACSGEHP